MSKLAQKYARLSVSAKYIVWAVYGATVWGGLMLLFSFWAERWMGHDPWRNFSYTLIACAAGGAAWGVIVWRKIERRIQERIRRGKV